MNTNGFKMTHNLGHFTLAKTNESDYSNYQGVKLEPIAKKQYSSVELLLKLSGTCSSISSQCTSIVSLGSQFDSNQIYALEKSIASAIYIGQKLLDKQLIDRDRLQHYLIFASEDNF